MDDEIRYDTLGRRIPTFDRKKAAQKAAKTAKERYGEDWHSLNMSKGGKKSFPNKGYARIKKDNPEELKRISKEAAHKRWQNHAETDTTQAGQANQENRPQGSVVDDLQG